MTTVMFRPCVKFFFETHTYYENNYFVEGREGKIKIFGMTALFLLQEIRL